MEKEDSKFLIMGIVCGLIIMSIIKLLGWINETYINQVPYNSIEEVKRVFGEENENTNTINRNIIYDDETDDENNVSNFDIEED